jgi:cysteine synthase A
MGVGRRLRQQFSGMRLVAVEPSESPVMSGGAPGPHAISGIGDGFIPQIASDGAGGRHPLIDDVICVSTSDARAAARELSDNHGLCVGVSSGANFLAARRLAEQHHVVVTVFPDGYAKYLSVGLRHCELGRCAFEHESLVSPHL